MTDDQYKTGGFIAGYPLNIRSYYSPVDNVHGKLLDLIKSAKHSLILGMYGLDDEELVAAIVEKMNDENVYVQLTLDKSQAGGVHERVILAANNFPGTTIAVGHSEKGAIMHMKVLVIDNAILVTGSTNWSNSGESLQDNACVVIQDAYVAGEAASRVSVIHANMLAQAKRNQVTK